MSRAAYVGMAVLALASLAILIWPSKPSGGPQARPVYRVGAVSTAVRTGQVPGSGYLGEVRPGALLKPVPAANAADGWLAVEGLNWHGWVDPRDLQGPLDQSVPASALAPLDRIDRF